MSQQRPNLLAIQARMNTSDYRSPEAFFERLLNYMERAKAQGQLSSQSIVVFPEYIGAWLVLVGEDLKAQNSAQRAALSLISRRPLNFITQLLHNYQYRNPFFEACYRVKATQMAQIYFDTFSELAKRFNCTVVAGSTVLPGAQIKQGRLVIDQGKLWRKVPLENVSLVFKPGGEVYPEIVRKHFLTSEERGYTSPGSLSALPYFDTPVGRVGVLICADAWFPICYQLLNQLQAEYVVVPVMITDPALHTAAWRGYDHAQPPKGIWREQVGQITHAEAWSCYTLVQGMKGTNIKQGLMSCLQGQVLAFNFTALTLAHGNAPLAQVSEHAEFINVEL